MLRRIALRDFVIVSELDVEFEAGFSVLTGETGAGKSILIDALQLALGSRGDAGVVREGAQRTEITAVFDTPPALHPWLDEAGFEIADELLLRRTIDAQGKSRAWINGSPATVAQLRAAGEALVDIHGQHAWQSLTRADAVRGLLDAYAGTDLKPLAAAWQAWREAQQLLDDARTRQADLERERERLAWQIGEVDKLAPGADEWDELNAEHRRLAHAQSLIDAVQAALDAVSEADQSADALTGRAVEQLQDVAGYDASLASVIEVLQSAQAQLQDASHSLHGYLRHVELDPERLQELDERLSTWMSLARRYRRPPEELPALLEGWKDELRRLDAATDLEALERAAAEARQRYDEAARKVSQARRQAAPKLAATVTQAMQSLGMAGGRFEVALVKLDAPQSFGLEAVEFLVAGHEGSTPRPLAKVASGGELSRIALAIAVTTSRLGEAGTLIFDEVDSGVGGAVAETVGRLMKQLGVDRQVLAVTHLPQVAACADHHYVVSKATRAGVTTSEVRPVAGEQRVAEIARMLGGQQLSGTSFAHAQEMLETAAAPVAAAPTPSRGRRRP
ncbi:DNA repair protein RecN [Caldimonas thermodepolymerans]|jgi:DNA repair protein RecN|nr:DNA repair protein RecN [Caldimonas thermodepolymerans]QPC30971.1 DNA repair protein RecN [Caldimonas thermodepolymerans]RDH97014.1 DNA replication and repair protein RecN [Caldimonas thermodepolymerans]TCP09083.1 DNA replication and repair protein RecN [Caldimonas thermodepolymerans]UZG43713.1 DNA repair protein RecN [Caldimonas thermodepolymerans]UZG47378.1 DNA repair protein RecN [Caldimonas thermodepolymerans]